MSAREQWEYEVYRMNNVNGDLQALLTKFGDDGWELVALLSQPPHTNLVFKRKK